MPLPKKAAQQLERSLRTADWDLFKDVRYTYGEEGTVFVIENLDLSGLKLGRIPSTFLCFKNCNLEGVSFEGMCFWPMGLWSCRAQRLNLKNTHGMLFAFRTDFRGAQFNEGTELFPSWHTDLPSALEQCQIDEDFQDFLTRRGVTLYFPESQSIPSYAFGATGLY